MKMYKVLWLDSNGKKHVSMVQAITPWRAHLRFEELGFGTVHDIVNVEKVSIPHINTRLGEYK